MSGYLPAGSLGRASPKTDQKLPHCNSLVIDIKKKFSTFMKTLSSHDMGSWIIMYAKPSSA